MKTTFPRVALASALLSALLISGCDQQQAAGPQGRPPAQVGVITVEPQPYTLTTTLPGRTTAYRSAEVRPQVSGIILKRQFTEGSEVKAGQPLYQIDPATYEAAVKSAEATLLSARTLAERYKVLVKDQAVSRQQYDEARAAMLQAEAALEQAKISLRYTRVLAPISGRIGRSLVTEGALVSNGQSQQLAVIQQLDPIHVDVTQSATELLRLRRNLSGHDKQAAVSLQLPDGSAYAHSGTLEFSEVTVDEGTGSVTLRASFPNPEGELLPGLFVQAKLEVAELDSAILVPQQGVTRNPKGEAVAMVVTAGNKVELRVLDVVPATGSYWLVRSGLQAGDQLITEGLQFIQPGAEVVPQPASNAVAYQAASQPAAAAPAR